MKNITVTLDDHLYRQSRITAAQADTTITALVREFLTLLTDSESSTTPQKDILAVIEALTDFPSLANSLQIFREALKIQTRFQSSFWDANIIAAAHKLDCTTLCSEDLNHSQNYGGVTVINPFL
ncbi:MAG: putative nucleic acid-binding protein [Akkermansiaceae bacterium]|jgi:predicted nucleic acid-binding protein